MMAARAATITQEIDSSGDRERTGQFFGPVHFPLIGIVGMKLGRQASASLWPYPRGPMNVPVFGRNRSAVSVRVKVSRSVRISHFTRKISASRFVGTGNA